MKFIAFVTGLFILPCAVWSGDVVPAQPLEMQGIKDVEYLVELAQVHIKFGSPDRAEPLLRSALEKSSDPKQRQQVYVVLASLLQCKGDLKESAAIYETALSGASSPAERSRLQMSLAKVYVETKEYARAENLLSELMKSPEHALKQDAQRTLLQVWQAQPGRIDLDIHDLVAALNRDSQDAESIERLALIYSTVKPDPKKAAEYNARLSDLRPDDKDLQRKNAVLYQQSGQTEKALEMASASNKSESEQQAMQIGQLMLQSGKKDDAVAWMKQNVSENQAVLVSFYEQSGLLDEAVIALNQMQAASKSPQEKADIALRLADYSIMKKDFAKAEQQIHAVLAEAKDNPGIYARGNNALARLEKQKAQKK